MRRDGDVLPEVEQAGCKRGQQFIRGMVMNCHDKSPNRLRSRFIASRNRDFTVPSGIPSICAISAWAFSSKKDSSTTRKLIFGQRRQGAADPCLRLGRGYTRVWRRSLVDVKLGVDIARISRAECAFRGGTRRSAGCAQW